MNYSWTKDSYIRPEWIRALDIDFGKDDKKQDGQCGLRLHYREHHGGDPNDDSCIASASVRMEFASKREMEEFLCHLSDNMNRFINLDTAYFEHSSIARSE